MRTSFQLFAHQVVWRVVEVIHTTEDGRLMAGRIGYRWSEKGANRLAERWRRETSRSRFGSGFLVQAGVVHWVPDDEWNTAVDNTDWNRQQNVDDREEAGPFVTWSRPDHTEPNHSGVSLALKPSH